MRTFISACLMIASIAGCSKSGSSATTPGTQAGAVSGGQTKNKPAPATTPVADPTAKERAKLIGTWIAKDGEFQGVRMTPAGLKDMKWVFTADKVTYSVFGKKLEATYSLQPSANPKTFDFKGPETAIQGIYEVKGDELKVCYAATERPSAFATGGTSQDTLMIVFQKAK
jgi:uncharacterized protein (TIGR03067 family)